MTRVTAYQHLQTTILRGGRVTKWKGIVASIAPLVGAVVMPVMLAGAINLGGARGAMAGTCTPISTGIWECSGPAGSDVPQDLNSGSNSAAVTTLPPVFGISTSIPNSTAILIRGTGGVSFTDNYSSVITNSVGAGISAVNYGTDGALTLTSSGVVDAREGVLARNYGTDLTVRVNNVYAVLGAVEASQNGSGTLTVSASGNVVTEPDNGQAALRAFNFAGGDTIVEANYTRGHAGIVAFNLAGTGDLTITSDTAIGVNNSFSSGIGLWAYNRGTSLSIESRNSRGY